MNSDLSKLELFIKNNECDSTKNIISTDVLKIAEEQIGIKFGGQLIEYLTHYGYLGYKSIEFYGMNSNQGLNSDLFEQTKYLHEYFEITKPYIVVEKVDESLYALVDSNDNVYKCNLESNQIEELNIKLFDYILKRFEGES